MNGPDGLRAKVRRRIGPFELDVELDVAAGRTVAVVGRNGSGKTTLLSVLAGLLVPEQGLVTLDGTVLDDVERAIHVAPEHRAVGFVFQDNLLFPHLSIEDNVAFGVRARGAGRGDARRVARAWLDRMGLADRSTDRPGQLSGGQAQRVALARALAPDPRLVLLDEPLAALDATVRVDVRRMLRQHLAEDAAAHLLVTHDPVDAAALADHIVVLDAGRIVQAGRLDELTARPRTSYVADLMGMNLLSGRSAGDGMAELTAGGRMIAADDGGTAAGERVFVAVRPAAVVLHPHEPDGSARNRWPVTVVSVDVEPGRVRVRLDGAPAIVAEVTAGAVTDLGLEPGRTVWAAVKATEVLLSPA